MQSTSLRLSKKTLNQARDRLLAFQEEKMEANEDMKPIIIRENVSLEAYTKYREIERKLPVSIRSVEGKIIAHEVPLTSHGLVVNRIGFLIYAWNIQLRGANKEDIIVGPNSYYTTDLTIRPRGLPRPSPGQGSNSEGRPYPTLVVEVGDCESVPSLHDLSTDSTRAMLALRYLRTNQINTVPDIIISFGIAPLHHNTIEFLTNIDAPLANIVGVGVSTTACNSSVTCDHVPSDNTNNLSSEDKKMNAFLNELHKKKELQAQATSKVSATNISESSHSDNNKIIFQDET
ncbi:17034_t:CDS:2, partial [Acaulospora morrowiae]